MKIPDITEVSPELRDEQARYDQLVERENEVGQKVRKLRSMKNDGELTSDSGVLVDLVLAGKEVPTSIDIESELKRGMAEWHAIESAKEIQVRKIEESKKAAERKLCDSLRPEHDKLVTRLCKSLAETHAAYIELFRMKRHLAGNGIGFCGLFAVEPEFLDPPTDRTTHFADFFRDAKTAGYVSTIPAEFR